MARVLVVIISYPERSDAEYIADASVRDRLAACAQVFGPTRSTFRWRGKLKSEEEWFCHLKTTPAKYPAVERFIKRHHPYEEPEIIAFEVKHGSTKYLRWVEGEVNMNTSKKKSKH
ncbi:divalent-cation tolerance protein CutA [Candidatus Uhrbacteria bacterium]|nr:divalent-cation tolerance protein CutA [Candidatus Uhrbacteria bacterium]